MSLSGIPLTRFGVVVGSVTIDDEGTVSIESMESPCRFAQSLKKKLEAGDIDSLAVVPNTLRMEGI